MRHKLNKHHTVMYILEIIVFLVAVFFVQSLGRTNVSAVSIGEEFSEQNIFVDGVLVGIDSEDTENIVASNLNNDKYTIGVTQDIESNLVTITKDYSSKPIAISGTVSVLASDINGEIKEGDLVTASWIDGVVMKAQLDTDARIVGIALENFSSLNSKSYENIEIIDRTVPSVKVNYLKLRLSDGDVFAGENVAGSTGGLVDKLVGKEVSVYKLVAGLFIFVTSVVIAGLFIYSSIKGSFTAFGRNPLASNSIYVGLIQISTISVAFLSVGAALAFLLWVV